MRGGRREGSLWNPGTVGILCALLMQELYGECSYEGKKFSASKETALLILYQVHKITFETDLESADYTMEHGATRNFQDEKLMEEEEKRVQKDRKDEELNNPTKVLENLTRDSKLEVKVLENWQELKKGALDFKAMLLRHCLENQSETAPLLEEAHHCRLLEDWTQKTKLPLPNQGQQQDPAPQPSWVRHRRPRGRQRVVSSRAQLARFVVPRKVKAEVNGGSEQVQMPVAGTPKSRKMANLAPQTP